MTSDIAISSRIEQPPPRRLHFIAFGVIVAEGVAIAGRRYGVAVALMISMGRLPDAGRRTAARGWRADGDGAGAGC